MKNDSNAMGKQIFVILLLTFLVSFGVNFIHPRGVKISFQRPPLQFASDSVFAETLPQVSIGGEKTQGMTIISYEQLIQLLKEKEMLLIDARSGKEYQQCHIPGAINIPYEQYFDYEEQISKFPKKKWLVCYCDGPPCDLGELLAEELKLQGFEKVAVYEGGMNDWKKHQASVKVDGEKDAK